MTIVFRDPIDKLGEICVEFDLEPNEVDAFADWLIRNGGNFIKGTVMLEAMTHYLVVNGYLEIDEKWPDGIEEYREVPLEEPRVDEPLPEPESEPEPEQEPEPEPEPEEDDLDEDDDDDGFPPLAPPRRESRTTQPIRKRRSED